MLNFTEKFVMKSIFLSLFSIFILQLTACFTVKSNDHFSYQKISPTEYSTLLNDSSNYYLIDVRTKGEFKKSHINNAINHSFLNFHFGKDVKNLDRSKLVFLYCQTCHRSPFAARTLKRKGFRKVYDLKGGYVKWPAVKNN